MGAKLFPYTVTDMRNGRAVTVKSKAPWLAAVAGANKLDIRGEGRRRPTHAHTTGKRGVFRLEHWDNELSGWVKIDAEVKVA